MGIEDEGGLGPGIIINNINIEELKIFLLKFQIKRC